MISYKEWQILKESLGSYTLGVRQPQAVSRLYSNYPGTSLDEKMFGDAGFGGMGGGFGGPSMPPPGPQGGMGGAAPPPPMPSKKNRKKDDEDLEDDEFEDDDEDLEDDGDEFEDEEGDDDEDLEGDEEGGFGEEEGEDDEEDEFSGPPKHPMGKGSEHMHDQRPFMKLSREGCGCDDKDSGEELLLDKGKEDSDDDDEEDGDRPAFLMKKKLKKGIKKGMKSDKCSTPSSDSMLKKLKWKNKGMKSDKCGSGMCKKCKKCKKMKAENYDYYRRPASYDDSEAAFLKSISGHMGNVNQKWDDGVSGMSEDLLLPAEPTPGSVGFAPQGRIGGQLGQDIGVTESMQYLMKKMFELEKKVKDM